MPDKKEKQTSTPSQNPTPTVPIKENFSVPERDTNVPKNPFENLDPLIKRHKDIPLKKSG